MAFSGWLSLFFADQILEKFPSLEVVEDEQLILPSLKDELGKVKKIVSALRAALLYAEGSRQWNKGLKAQVIPDDIFSLENDLCWVDKKVSELFCWVRETKRDREGSIVVMPVLLPCQLKSKSDRGMIDPKKIHNIISPDYDSDEDLRRESVSDLLISELDGLRALELHDLGIQSLPDYIDRLKHLRYLDVSRNPDSKLLPNSITNIFNLQTLKLSFCFGLQELPKDMKNLINLRHLEIEGCYNLRYMPPHLGQLTNLQTLSQFVLNDDARSAHDRKYCSQLKELGRFNSLRGEIKIKNLSSILVKDGKCKAAALGKKQHLQSLTLEWGVGEGRTDQYESQLEDLKPHQNLKDLSLNDYWGVNLSSWLLSGNHVQLVKLA